MTISIRFGYCTSLMADFPDVDLYRSAKLLLDRNGNESATMHASMKADDLGAEALAKTTFHDNETVN